MNEMRPRPALPPDADHEQHDPLLVAQHAAGDRLEARQQQEADRLVATCGACAALADDLRVLAVAVAREPLPPRRRDFRLGGDDAERLAAGPVTRLLRRLSLPRTRVFAPAAAGVLTVGLAFVVAGYAWPGEDVVDLPREAPMTQVAEPSRLGVDAQTVPPALEAGALDRNAVDEAPTALEADAFMAEEMVTQEGAGESAEKSLLADFASEGAPRAADQIEQSLGMVADDAAEPIESPMPMAVRAVPGDSLDTAATTDGDAAVRGGPDAEDGDFAPVLMGLGLALALAGGLALLLAWLARRATDPLLR